MTTAAVTVLHRESKKKHQPTLFVLTDKLWPILIILSLFHSEMNCRRSWSKICHLALNVLSHYLVTLNVLICRPTNQWCSFLPKSVDCEFSWLMQGSQLSWNSWNFKSVLKFETVLKFYSFGKNVLKLTWTVSILVFSFSALTRLLCVFSCLLSKNVLKLSWNLAESWS